MKQRLFISIDPGDELRQEIVDLQGRLEKLKIPINFEPAEKLHMTLNFIGAVNKDSVGEFSSMVRAEAGNFSPFNLTPAFLETLYQKHDTSLIYLGFNGDMDALKSLHALVKDRLVKMRIPQPTRFLPHITIGRFKKTDPVMTKSFMDKINDFDYQPLSEFTIDHIDLMDSLLSKEGSHFRRIGRFMLK